ncbi:CDP-diacylglycerol--glycerol-3-phosphate 3-phosphatidyltransferase [Clostridium gasigenes]|uniref:CDP-diacylglycerol--glycerol-3-phosphate 3-phosphatidyltransferase n=1 Tax=Clostridium gasigenes TaxID=94869 RepID=A0A1H0R636_9CLOT|nr:CDP-diacylglycerol--glycerol-3-phosphate 3-phosphatidyltransferase [Clostridium gasigenes]MBB6622946.1 CDP-diacylglycerol--glycerol-3-phosphate 3-phosphatidyltransferase [Clostridium gasigenes]MBB6715074.1 CDP-diacylglycerol--glycerol-3-phosphate 3-phosphatidyltransferase [Clostridium gasigenes]MBU3087716.1 CDP-diacylglycerol--glycerol-3-phosphate 3-phosphatidyltransferase [Clostridium gasigenes]MBU3104025.1 CDP-diacylglycerol--glycerol-3-phosphate 3-phosphatidyltransferase [Clostridium gasi
MNLANKLTMLRIFLVPLFLIFIAAQGIPFGTFIATIIFIIASLTDQLDGYIARSRNQVTTFGKFMDPLADKLLVTAALISLVGMQVIPSWAAVIIIAREFAVSGLRTLAASEGKIISASYWGKVKTVIQIIAIVALLIQASVGTSKYLTSLVVGNVFMETTLKYVPNTLLILAVIATILSGVDYFRKNKKVINMDK